MKRLFRGSPDHYLILDPDYRIVDATDRYLEATMTRREEILGRDIFDVFPENPEDASESGEANLRASLGRVSETLKPDTMAVQKYDVRDPEAGEFQTRYWSPVNTPLLDENGQLWLIVHRVEDVTEFVRAQELSERRETIAEELRGRVENMQAEILRRGAELQETNNQLRAASNAKNEFLSRMSHELRTPLTAVIGYSELLKLELEPGSQTAEDVDAIFKAGTHLSRLVDEVLDLARIEEGRLQVAVESVLVGEVLDEAIELSRPMAERERIDLVRPEVDPQAKVVADRQRLKQVAINLITNGIKYNSPGGSLRLSVGEGRPGHLRIEFTDTGRGVAPDKFERLFVPFDRLGAEASGVEGTGLGLALSKKLIKAMKGTIEVESTVGEGTTFAVELPRSETLSAADSAEEEPVDISLRTYPSERKVLYIEDTMANLELIESMLRRRPSVTLIPAMLGRRGLELARELGPDLILLDLNLPDVDGPDILEHLRSHDETRSIPVVVLSADATEQQREKLLSLGADAYKTKPISIAELLSTVDDFLANPT